MPQKRVYPSWLPPNPRERAGLLQIRYRQRIVIAWLIALSPVGWLAAVITHSDSIFVPLTIFWILVGIGLAQRVSMIPCPRCGGKFCERAQLPFWYGLLNRRCENCGLTLEAQKDLAK
jgi:hypothetical protein